MTLISQDKEKYLSPNEFLHLNLCNKILDIDYCIRKIRESDLFIQDQIKIFNILWDVCSEDAFFCSQRLVEYVIEKEKHEKSRR